MLIDILFSLLQDLTGQNSNDSGGSGGAGRATTPHLRPTPSPTGSSGSRSMSPAVGKSFTLLSTHLLFRNMVWLKVGIKARLDLEVN